MASNLHPNGSALISVKDAASRYAYSPAYLARLARNGRVKATLRDNKWFIDAVSLENFLNSAGRARKRNKNHFARMGTGPALKQAKYSAALSFHQAASGPINLKSLLESLAIAGCSVIVGTILYGAAEADLSLVGLTQETGHIFAKVYVQATVSAEEALNVAAGIISQATR